MKLLRTEDNSFTCHNAEFDEHYHTKSGAIEEAFEKHVKPLHVTDGMHVLDFCFGLGYNTLAAFHGHKNISAIALELDPEIIEMMEKIEAPKEIAQEFAFFKNIGKEKELCDTNGNHLQLIMGNAMETIKDLENDSFDVCFFDPFSPGKHPEMWSVDVFKEVFRVLKKGGKLSTYSCARRVRDNLKKAGFLVTDGPIVGRRSPSTIAIKE